MYKQFKRYCRRKLREEAEVLYGNTGYNIAAIATHPKALVKGLSVETSLDLRKKLSESKPLPPKGPVPPPPGSGIKVLPPRELVPPPPGPGIEALEATEEKSESPENPYMDMSSTVTVDPEAVPRPGSENTTDPGPGSPEKENGEGHQPEGESGQQGASPKRD